MRIGAILTVGRTLHSDRLFTVAAGREGKQLLGDYSYVLTDVLGESVLDRVISQLAATGSLPPSVVSADPAVIAGSQRSFAPGTVFNSWDKAAAAYVSNGVELLLSLRVNAYADIDYPDLLRYHMQTRSVLTHVHAADGALDIAVLDAAQLRGVDGSYRIALRNLIPRQKRFAFTGYVNRLRRPHEFYRLAMDGLCGNCSLQPRGEEIQRGIWAGENVTLSSSSSVTAPAFLGAGVRIEAGCRVTGPSVLERDCVLDCETTVGESCILPETYVGVALDIRRAVVGSGKLFHLDRNVEVSIADRRLIGTSSRSISFLSGLGSVLRGGDAQAAD